MNQSVKPLNAALIASEVGEHTRAAGSDLASSQAVRAGVGLALSMGAEALGFPSVQAVTLGIALRASMASARGMAFSSKALSDSLGQAMADGAVQGAPFALTRVQALRALESKIKGGSAVYLSEIIERGVSGGLSATLGAAIAGTGMAVVTAGEPFTGSVLIGYGFDRLTSALGAAYRARKIAAVTRNIAAKP
jgi:hypothetical protein